MFITVTLPHGIGYIRADRVQAVVPAATEGKCNSYIELFDSPSDEDTAPGWYVMEDPAFVMDKIAHELRTMPN